MSTTVEEPIAVPAQPALLMRSFGWSMLATLAAFLLNNWLTAGREWPGIAPLFGGGEKTGLSWLQLLIYALGIVIAVVMVFRTRERSLRSDSALITRLCAYLARAAFFAVLFVGLGDFIISALRVENALGGLVSEHIISELGRAHFRGPYVHLPLMLLGAVVALFTRSLGFIWLALLVVLAELGIVIMRFIFSYEQAYMGDLVRFWHAALFLFASAYTLLEEGHVRVDVLYASFTSRTKAFFNMWGSLLMGITVCWTIIIIGMNNKAAIINSPMLNYEISQSAFGLYVKYLMAGQLGVFAILMLVQFVAYLLESVADYRNEAGGRPPPAAPAH